MTDVPISFQKNKLLFHWFSILNLTILIFFQKVLSIWPTIHYFFKYVKNYVSFLSWAFKTPLKILNQISATTIKNLFQCDRVEKKIKNHYFNIECCMFQSSFLLIIQNSFICCNFKFAFNIICCFVQTFCRVLVNITTSLLVFSSNLVNIPGKEMINTWKTFVIIYFVLLLDDKKFVYTHQNPPFFFLKIKKKSAASNNNVKEKSKKKRIKTTF